MSLLTGGYISPGVFVRRPFEHLIGVLGRCYLSRVLKLIKPVYKTSYALSDTAQVASPGTPIHGTLRKESITRKHSGNHPQIYFWSVSLDVWGGAWFCCIIRALQRRLSQGRSINRHWICPERKPKEKFIQFKKKLKHLKAFLKSGTAPNGVA